MTEAHGSFRVAFAISLVVALVSALLLFQQNVRAARAPSFSRGGTFSDHNLVDPQNLSVPTPTPSLVPSGSSHSAATLTAPTANPSTFTGSGTFPPRGHYVYKVEGTESAEPFGSRDYPPQMTMTVDHPASAKLKPDEFVFDLVFSKDHEEREIVQYTKSSVAFTYEAGNITFGPGFSESDEANYDPAMTQIPLPLKVGTTVSGKTTATAPDGSQSRIEDWTVTVERQENLTVLGRSFKTFVVKIHRLSESGGNEDVDRTREYWYSPEGNVWLKWIEDFSGSKKFGPGTFTYTTHFTATLDQVEPL